jgi:prevent-host-death family protein
VAASENIRKTKVVEKSEQVQDGHVARADFLKRKEMLLLDTNIVVRLSRASGRPPLPVPNCAHVRPGGYLIPALGRHAPLAGMTTTPAAMSSPRGRRASADRRYKTEKFTNMGPTPLTRAAKNKRTTMKKVNLTEAKARLSQLVRQAAKGEGVIIARSGIPMAKLVPLDDDKPKKLKLGTLKRVLTEEIAKAIEAPLSDDII